jgi:hypothetical protein
MTIIQQASADGLFPPNITSVERAQNALRIQADPGANRAASWSPAGMPVGMNGGLVVFETMLNGPTRFYRVAARR